MSDTPSPALLEALLEQSTDLLTVLDAEASIVYQSPSVERILGYDPAAVVGEDVFEYVHPEDRDRAREAFAEVALGPREEGDPIELRLRAADGSHVWVETLGRVADAPELDGYVVNSRVIMDRKRAERERDELLDRMTDGFLAIDDEWRFTYINDRAETLLERPAPELLGENVWEAFEEARESVIYDQYQEAMDTQEPVSFEVRYDPLGKTFEVRAFPSETGLSVYFRDVTEARRIKRRLEQTVGTLQRLYEITSDTELSLPEKRERVLELGRTHLDLPYGFTTTIDGETQRIVDALGTHELLQPGESCPIEESYCRKTIETDSLLAVHDAIESGWQGDPAYETFGLGSYIGGRVEVDGQLRGTLCFASPDPRGRAFTDSDRAFVELASRWLAYELEEAAYRRRLERQNERLERFASVVSHDLRNPLTVVKGHLDHARETHDDERLETADEALDRAFGLIEDVLEFARMGDGTLDRGPVELAAVAESAWELAGTEAGTLTVAYDDAPVSADRSRLQQLLENLFRNSIDHAGEEITVRVGALDDRPGFYVADDGPGIPESQRDSMFEFGRSGAGGTGIGLAIVREIVDAHGWSIRVTESEPGGGERSEGSRASSDRGSGGARFEVAFDPPPSAVVPDLENW